MTKGKRWLKVTISYREGERVDQWNAVELAETSMLQEVADASLPTLGAQLDDLAATVRTAAVELVHRGDLLSPLIAEPDR